MWALVINNIPGGVETAIIVTIVDERKLNDAIQVHKEQKIVKQQ